MSLLFKSTRTSQPQTLAGLSEQAIADGCVSAVLQGIRSYDAAQRKAPAIGSGVSYVATPYGMASRGAATNSGIALASGGYESLMPLAKPHTVLMLVRINTTGSRRFICGSLTSGGSGPQYSIHQLSDSQLRVEVPGAATLNGGTLTAGWHWIEDWYDLGGNSHRAYLDGVQTDANSAPAKSASAGKFRLQSGGEYTSEAFDGDIAACLIFEKALSASQRARYKENPNLAFSPQSRSLWLPGAVAAGGGDPTGTLSATESGSDTASLSGQIVVKGALASTESGADTAAISGSAATTVTGTLSATETGTDTATITGKVVVTGALSVSETGADTALVNGSSVIITTGTCSATESGGDTCAATGDVLITGLLAAAEAGGDTAYAPGQIYVLGALAATEAGSDTCVIQQTEIAFDPSIYVATSPAMRYLATSPAQSYTVSVPAQNYSA